MHPITYKELVDRYGQPMAFDLLLTFEKLAKIKADIAMHDEEQRLKQAIERLNETEFAA